MSRESDPELRPFSAGDARVASPFADFSATESTRSGALIAGRYLVKGFLTRGATARVYLAEDMTTKSPVALKILAPETALSPEFRVRLLREAEAMK